MRGPHPYNPFAAGLFLLMVATGARAADPAPKPLPAKQSIEPSAIPAPSVPAGSERGVLVLQDGGVLEGQITRVAEWYLVTRAGGQMQVAASRVEFAGRTLHDAYLHRAEHVAQATGEARLALAEWCLRYGLVDEAQTEWQKAQSIGARPGKLQLVERAIAAAKTRLKAKSTVTPAAYIEEKLPEQASPPKGMARELPEGALELFTRRIQPILVNNCTAAKCHQPGGQQQFQLNRALLRGEANRRTTMQNLYAALALVDRERPEASLLLTLPRRTHGGMNAPIFGARQQAAVRHLAEWVELIAPAPPADPPAESRSSSAQPLAGEPLPAARAPISQAQYEEVSGPEPPGSAVAPSAESLRTPRRLQYGGSLQPWQPRDEFDPEIFNRQSEQGLSR